jgi:hypothetical protein
MKFTTVEVCKNINAVEDIPVLCKNIPKFYSDKTMKADSLNSTESKLQHRDYEKGF